MTILRYHHGLLTPDSVPPGTSNAHFLPELVNRDRRGETRRIHIGSSANLNTTIQEETAARLNNVRVKIPDGLANGLGFPELEWQAVDDPYGPGAVLFIGGIHEGRERIGFDRAMGIAELIVYRPTPDHEARIEYINVAGYSRMYNRVIALKFGFEGRQFELQHAAISFPPDEYSSKVGTHSIPSVLDRDHILHLPALITEQMVNATGKFTKPETDTGHGKYSFHERAVIMRKDGSKFGFSYDFDGPFSVEDDHIDARNFYRIKNRNSGLDYRFPKRLEVYRNIR